MTSAQTGASVWEWHPHPEIWLVVALLLGSYIWAVGVLGPRHAPGHGPPATGWQKTAFLLGVAAIWAGEEWPIHELAEDYLFSAHMVQHLLFAYVAPPLLLLGTPPWLMRLVLGRGFRLAIFRRLQSPLVSFVLFNGTIALMHYGPVVSAQHNSMLFHLFFHMALISTGILIWSLVVDTLPELKRFNEPMKMGWLFLQSIIPTVPASFITFTDRAFYDVYIQAPRVFEFMTPLTDQRTAGLLMKIGGGLLLWGVIAVIFFRWYAKDQRQETGHIEWDEFERELDVWDLRR